jgi:hypothetical protein
MLLPRTTLPIVWLSTVSRLPKFKALWLWMHAVEKPREHAVDAEVFCQLTEVGVDLARKLSAHQQVRKQHAEAVADGFMLMPVLLEPGNLMSGKPVKVLLPCWLGWLTLRCPAVPMPPMLREGMGGGQIGYLYSTVNWAN